MHAWGKRNRERFHMSVSITMAESLNPRDTMVDRQARYQVAILLLGISILWPSGCISIEERSEGLNRGAVSPAGTACLQAPSNLPLASTPARSSLAWRFDRPQAHIQSPKPEMSETPSQPNLRDAPDDAAGALDGAKASLPTTRPRLTPPPADGPHKIDLVCCRRPMRQLPTERAKTNALDGAVQFSSYTALPEEAAEKPIEEGGYLIQPGDQLAVKFRQTPQLNEEVTVRPDGMISLPIVNDVAAAGSTPEGLRRRLVTAYGPTLKDPEITVIVKRFAGNHVFVGGEVEAPGLIPISGRMTLLQAIIQAGGFRDTADLKGVIVRREGGTQCRLNLKRELCGRAAGQDIVLRPYDVVYVRRSPIAKVNLFVEQYIDKVIPFQRTFGVFINHVPGSVGSIVP